MLTSANKHKAQSCAVGFIQFYTNSKHGSSVEWNAMIVILWIDALENINL